MENDAASVELKEQVAKGTVRVTTVSFARRLRPRSLLNKINDTETTGLQSVNFDGAAKKQSHLVHCCV